jgi:hypothetical protein
MAEDSMASAIEDPTSLPGETLHDQDGGKVGTVKQVYAVNDDQPMWVTVDIETGIGQHRLVFVPLARLKHERDQLRSPYDGQHLLRSPEIEVEEEVPKEADRALRNFYAIDLGDQEQRTDNESYAAQIPEGDEPPRRMEGEESGQS